MNEPLRSAWRKRAARALRRFHKVRGHWPERYIVEAMKRGIEQCVRLRIEPPVEH